MHASLLCLLESASPESGAQYMDMIVATITKTTTTTRRTPIRTTTRRTPIRTTTRPRRQQRRSTRSAIYRKWSWATRELGVWRSSSTTPTFWWTGLAKAWALWNGQSATPAFADSFNCSSLVDSGTGIYNPQLTNAMSASNFVSATSAHAAGVAWTAAVYVGGRTTNQMHYQTVYSSNQTAVDSNPCDIVSFGDLA